MEGDEFNELVNDINEFGQIEPATLYENKILDGRNRYRACKILGIKLQTRLWNKSDITGRTPLQYVISENIMRRHLNTAQKAEIGMILLPTIQKQVREDGMKQAWKTRKSSQPNAQYDKNSTTYLVAKKVHVNQYVVAKVKKITEIAKDNTNISEQWEKAKKGDVAISRVYQEALITEQIKDLSKKQQERILGKLTTGESTPEQLKREVQDLKDNISREKIIKRQRIESTQKAKIDKISLAINNLTREIYQLENTLSLIRERLNKLSEQALKEYPQIESEDPAVIITALGLKYEKLNTSTYDTGLRDLRTKYKKLREPLIRQLDKLDKEYKASKANIEANRQTISQESVKIEELQMLLNGEYERQELTIESIEELKSKLELTQKEYDDA